MNFPRWYPILDTAFLSARGLDTEIAARGLLSGGARILQYRHKAQWTRQTLEQAEAVGALCREYGAMFVINDRADMAALAGADLHLGQTDLPPAEARKVVGDAAKVGFSTHNESQLRAAGSLPVDYVALGPIFGTTSKANPDPVVGLNELRRLRPLTTRPLIAIGGIRRGAAQEVLAAGADSVAIISDICPDVNSETAWRHVAYQWITATNG